MQPKLGRKLLRYAIASFAAIATETVIEIMIPGNTAGEKVGGIITGILVGTGVNKCLEEEHDK